MQFCLDEECMCLCVGILLKCVKLEKEHFTLTILRTDACWCSACYNATSWLSIQWKHHGWLSCLVSMAHVYMFHVPGFQTHGFPRAWLKSSFHTSRTENSRRPHQSEDEPKKREKQSDISGEPEKVEKNDKWVCAERFFMVRKMNGWMRMTLWIKDLRKSAMVQNEGWRKREQEDG